MRILLISLAGLILLLLPVSVLAANTDQDYEKSGEGIMDQMMGSQHETADKNIEETMGTDFLRQMHVAMGKMAERNLSGNSNLGMMPMMSMMMGGGGVNMMGNWGGMMGSGFGVYAILAWLTWGLIIIALVLGSVWLWKQIQKK